MKTVTVILGTPVPVVRHCEQSEAIHACRTRDMDCFVAALLAMTKPIFQLTS
jgi:hypothetical protein